MQVLEPGLELCLVGLPSDPINARRGLLLQLMECFMEKIGAEVMEERGELLLLAKTGHLAELHFQRRGNR